jgi:hypothetical protein
MLDYLFGIINKYLSARDRYPGEMRDVARVQNDAQGLFEAILSFGNVDHLGMPTEFYAHTEHCVIVSDENKTSWHCASLDEIFYAKVSKFILDAWNRPIMYRLVKRKSKEGGQTCYLQLYSTGPKRMDESIGGELSGDDFGRVLLIPCP